MSKFCRPIAYLNSCVVELDYLIENDAGKGMSELHLAEKAEHDAAIAVLEAAGKAQAEQDYDPGLLNDHGGGNVAWWHDYIRYEVGRCNAYWRQFIEPEDSDG